MARLTYSICNLGLLTFLIVSPVRTVTAAPPDSELSFDVVIYGGTSAAVTAAVQVSRMDRSVAIVCPDTHPGGLSSSGLGYTDTGNKSVIGGLAREFYHRVWQHYQDDDAWTWQPRSEYGNKGQGTPAIDGTQRTMWIFEPHVAEQVFERLRRGTRDPGLPRRMARSGFRRHEGGTSDHIDPNAQRHDDSRGTCSSTRRTKAI